MLSVEVVGRTTIDPLAISRYMEDDYFAEPMETLIEFAGRACYQSFNKPNEATRSNTAYIANIIAQGHESVLEHSSVSFYVQGVSRNMLLELERHRHLSFSVISTRFVDSSTAKVVIPPALEEPGYTGLMDLNPRVSDEYRRLVAYLVEDGSTRKEAREAARFLLPGNLETKFVVTGNLRAWRDVLKKRYSVHADKEILRFAGRVLQLLHDEAPAVFADFPTSPFE